MVNVYGRHFEFSRQTGYFFLIKVFSDWAKVIVPRKITIISNIFLIIENKLIVNKETIINYFDEVINNNSFKEEDLNLLRLKKAIYISDISMEQEILGLLNPIINSNSVWKNHALKFLGDFFTLKK